jgi:hypothetical protein
MIIDCLSKAIFMYVIYLAISLMLFGVPKSLSATYYLFKDRVDNLKYLFPAMIVMMVMFMTPCWLELSKYSAFQFTAFLSMGGLLFVGATPTFRDSEMDSKIHDVAAYLCAILAVLWIVLVTQYWYILLIVCIVVGALAYVTKTWKTSHIFWLENAVLFSTFISMIAYFENYFKV